MINQTKENIKKKRLVKKRRRRLKVFRLVIFLFIMGIIGTLLVWAGTALYQWAGRTYAVYSSLYAGYQQRQELRQSAWDARFDGYTNVLFLGLDDGIGSDIGQLPDTMLLLSLNNSTGKLRIIAIPRDTLADIPGRPEKEQVNLSWYYGGSHLAEQTVSQLIGVSIHQYVAMDIDDLAAMLDILGGIDIYVEHDMDYADPEKGLDIHIRQGFQHIDGSQAQKYLRYRGDDLGDVGRLQRQQRFLKAFYAQLLSVDTVTKLPAMAEFLQTHIQTSAEIFDAVKLAGLLKNLSTSQPEAVILPGSFPDGNDNLWLPDRQKITELVDDFFPQPDNE